MNKMVSVTELDLSHRRGTVQKSFQLQKGLDSLVNGERLYGKSIKANCEMYLANAFLWSQA
jgi:hypothetical protein